MPRTDPTRVRTAPFVVGPWRRTTKKKKEGNGGDVDAVATDEATTTTTSTALQPPPPPRASLLQEESDRYDSAWDDDDDDLDLIEPPKKLSGRGYLSFCSSSSSSSTAAVVVSGHFVDASTSRTVGVSGVEIDSEGLGDDPGASDVPHADACSFAAGDRLLSLALFLKHGGKKGEETATEATEATRAGAAADAKSRTPLEATEPADAQIEAGGDSRPLALPLMATAEATRAAGAETANVPLPSAVVLAMASGGDAATVSAPAPDPTGQGARRLLLAFAAAASSKSSRSSPCLLLSPPRGVKPPRLKFECDTLLDGEDAASYLRNLGVESAGSSSSPVIVNVGAFEIVGLDDGSGDDKNDDENETTPFAAPARVSPSDPAYDSELDA